MDNKAELRDRLRLAMNLRQIKASKLSEMTGIPRGTISYYLSGKTAPKTDRIFLISKALDISEAWLLGYSVEMERSEGEKMNDKLVELIARMRSDDEFFSMVSVLANLPDEQQAIIKKLLSTLKR